jgi:hypothetical protein
VTTTVTVENGETGQRVFQTEDRRVVQASSRPEGQGVRADIPLAGIAPGKYVLKVAATSTGNGRSAQRAILFEVR